MIINTDQSQQILEEIDQLETIIEAHKYELSENPLAQFRGRQGKRIAGIRAVMKEGVVPDYFTKKQAEMFRGKELNPAHSIQFGHHKGKYPYDVAFDLLSKELNMTPDEIKDEIERICDTEVYIEELKHRVVMLHESTGMPALR